MNVKKEWHFTMCMVQISTGYPLKQTNSGRSKMLIAEGFL